MFLIDCLPLMVLISKSLRHLFLGVPFFGIGICLACASSGAFITSFFSVCLPIKLFLPQPATVLPPWSVRILADPSPGPEHSIDASA